MTSQPLIPGSSLSPESLLEVARLELARGGRRALSFRRLGEAAGVTLGALTYHLGDKASILSRLVEAERRRDGLWHSGWLDRLRDLDRLDGEGLATILELYLDDSVTGDARVTQLVFAELMLRSAVDKETAALMYPWVQDRETFWRTVFAGRVNDADERALSASAYLADETFHSLANGDNIDYRLLRRMALGRLANRLDPEARTGVSQAAAFTRLVERLNPGLALPGREQDSDLLNAGRQADLARWACAVMMEEGPEAVTHRAVGERAGAPASTVAYHFRSAPDLVRAALAMVYLVAQGRATAPVEDTPEQRIAVVARGTQAVALAAARDPALKPHALDLRRLRGENLFHLLKAEGLDRIDALDAQTASVAAIGGVALTGVDGRERISPLMAWLTNRLRN